MAEETITVELDGPMAGPKPAPQKGRFFVLGAVAGHHSPVAFPAPR